MFVKRIRLAVVATLAYIATAAYPQQALEIVTLRYRTAEQVLPTLRPLLEPGATLSGQGGQLIVRASPANLVEIRRVLEAIDRPLRRLQVSVRFDSASDAERRAIEARGSFGSRRAEVEVRADERRSHVEERVDQRVQVVEGGRAFIAIGQSRPLAQRQVIRTPEGIVIYDSTVMQDVMTGFEVAPRVSGESVSLDIAPQRETPGRLPGSVLSGRVHTSLSARLGEWTLLGEQLSAGDRDEGGFASAQRSRASEVRRIWVKIEEIAR